MPTQFFTVEPSADICLSLASAQEKSVTLRLWVYDSVAPPRYVTLPDPAVNFAQSRFDVIDNVGNDGKITAKAVGSCYVRVTFQDAAAGVFHQMCLRVTVFDSFASVWLGGNGQATVHDSRDDLVVSVYASNPAGDVRDITAHGFMRFSSLHPSIAAVDPASGRVFGLAIGTATIRGEYGGQQYDTQVEVVPVFWEPKPIVEKVWYNGSGPEYKNFLFLSEGFTADEYGKFKRIVHHIASRMRRAKVHEPYRLLKNSYNVWAAFEASKESGVSVGPLLDSSTGRDPQLSSTNRPQRHHKPLQVRASNLGLMYGRRMGDRISQFYTGAAQAPMNDTWYDPVDQFTFFYNDPRRTSTNLATWKANMFDHLGSLKTTEGPADPNHGIGQRWAQDGPDQGHVIVIVNDDHLSGNYSIMDFPWGVMYLWGALAINQKLKFNLVHTDHPGIDHRPSAPSLREATVAVAIHELSHSFFLGDEYEGASGFPGTEPAIGAVEWSYNITTRQFIVAGGITYIKWAEIKRVSRSSAVLSQAAGAAGGTIQLQLFPGEGSKWAPGDALLWLRTPNCNQGSYLPLSVDPFSAAQSLYHLYPARHRHAPDEFLVRITGVHQDTVTLQEAPGSPSGIGPATVIPARSVLFEPKLFNGNELGLVLPGVLDVITAVRGVGGAPPPATWTPLFSKAGNCGVAATGAASPPAGIAGIVYPKKWETLVGVYEGGGLYNCDVFRASGMSRMRDEYNTTNLGVKFIYSMPLDHLSKYVIVNQVDPSKHDLLDMEYPGEPL
jgi:hypothetical protein